jgi:hypothetical protein
MGKENINDLMKFMMPYPTDVKAAALWLREFVWDLYHETNELIYDNYNSVAFGWSPTDKAGDVFCSIALFSEHLNLGFNRGTDFPDPYQILIGEGSLYRYIRIKTREDFPENAICGILAISYENSVSRLKPSKKVCKGETIVKSISPVKRRPGMK